MKTKARRIALGTVLGAGLAFGAATYVIKQSQNAQGSATGPVANVSQTAPLMSSGGSAQKNAGRHGSSGRFTGPTVNAYYGYVKVQAVVDKGKLQNVVVLEHPNDNGTSRYINSVALPYLVKEAVQTQSANINLISGATFSSEAFVQSLSSALSKAGA